MHKNTGSSQVQVHKRISHGQQYELYGTDRLSCYERERPWSPRS